jgi:hypothetical protein
MFLCTPLGERCIETSDDLRLAIRSHHKGPMAAFWMSHEDFPVLFVGINNERAWLNYIPENEIPGFLSQGELQDDVPDIEFLDMDGHIDLRPSSCVVTLVEAEKAALEFFTSQTLPKCITWLEL